MQRFQDPQRAAERQLVGVGHERAARSLPALDGAGEPEGKPGWLSGSTAEGEATPPVQLEVVDVGNRRKGVSQGVRMLCVADDMRYMGYT